MASSNKLSNITLACDFRVSQINYFDDQIWEFSTVEGNPRAFSFQTTYGLRAKTMRMYPGFLEGDLLVFEPSKFTKPPSILCLYPNYLKTNFSPLQDVDVIMEYMVPASNACCGQICITNSGNRVRLLQFLWICQLIPIDGYVMTLQNIPISYYLKGKTSNIFPLVILGGVSQSGIGSLPSLSQSLKLLPGQTEKMIWAQAACKTEDTSFSLAQSLLTKKWDAEKVRLDLENSIIIEINTSNPEWDTILLHSQRLAFLSIINPKYTLPYPSFVISRLPDSGFSITGDGLDYNYLWNGQSTLDTYFIAQTFLSMNPSLVEGFILNFISTQRDDGFIDLKPGIGENRSNILATPCLAILALQVYSANENYQFLEQVYFPLRKFINYWLSFEKDHDQDGIPEWDNLLQIGLDDHPIFSFWDITSKGVDINTIESPALCTFLYQECLSLQRIAEIIKINDEIPLLNEKINILRSNIEDFWVSKSSCYLNRDRDSHSFGNFLKLGSRIGSGIIVNRRKLKQPGRLLIKINKKGDHLIHPVVDIYGSKNNIENAPDVHIYTNFKQFENNASLTTPYLFAIIDKIEIKGIGKEDGVFIWVIGNDYLDISLLLPFWAEIPDKIRANTILQKIIMNIECMNRPKGIPLSNYKINGIDSPWERVHFPWIFIILEGLVKYGFRHEASLILMKLMNVTIENDFSFRRSYHSITGEGFGEKNSLLGIIPIGILLKILGIQIYSSNKIFVNGLNPFPFNIDIKFKETVIFLKPEKTIIIFPDNQQIIITDEEPRLISHEYL